MLRDYLPYGPALTPLKAEHWLSQAREVIHYIKDSSSTSFPILPFQLFGVLYEEDIVIETKHPEWTMHEFAKVKSGDDFFWIAKDSDSKGIQTVTSNLGKLESWVAEIPIPRNADPAMKWEDRSTESCLDITVQYRNPLGEKVKMHFSSPRPPRPEKKRNGSTFDHSSQIVSALLDIPGKQMGRKVHAEMSFDGKPAKIRKVLGLVPVKALLQQTQGGFAIASMNLSSSEQGGTFRLMRPSSEQVIWNTKSDEQWSFDGSCATFSDPLSRWIYAFSNGELVEAKVFIYGQAVPVTRVRLSAPLPDLGRAFEGTVTRNFVMEINGQIQGYGKMEARNTDSGTQLKINPIAPYWFSSRPITTQVSLLPSGEVRVESSRA